MSKITIDVDRLVYAKKLNPAQRNLLKQFVGLTMWEPLGQDDLDAGYITFRELWAKNVEYAHDVYAELCNLNTEGTGAI